MPHKLLGVYFFRISGNRPLILIDRLAFPKLFADLAVKFVNRMQEEPQADDSQPLLKWYFWVLAMLLIEMLVAYYLTLALA